MSISTNRLENTRQANGCIVARCPACASEGGDRKGNNLAVFPNGAFYCHAHPYDRAHCREIYRLAGSTALLHHSSKEHELHRQRIEAQRQQEQNQAALDDCIRENRTAIIERYQWSINEVLADSPQQLSRYGITRSPQQFLSALFEGDDLIWTGDVHHSGHPRHSTRWRKCADWASERNTNDVGPYTTAASWKRGIYSRSDSNVFEIRYAVMDFDGLDGINPTTTREKDKLIADALAIVRMFRESLGWQLAAILHTGNKGIHAWFQLPSFEALESARKAAKPLGIDPKVLGSGQQPCRLPGHQHSKSGKFSELLWLTSHF